MEYVQIVFIHPDGDEPEKHFGGIAKYEHGKLVHVICGCCGGLFEADEVQIIRKFDDWLPISDEIIGE